MHRRSVNELPRTKGEQDAEMVLWEWERRARWRKAIYCRFYRASRNSPSYLKYPKMYLILGRSKGLSTWGTEPGFCGVCGVCGGLAGTSGNRRSPIASPQPTPHDRYNYRGSEMLNVKSWSKPPSELQYKRVRVLHTGLIPILKWVSLILVKCRTNLSFQTLGEL